MKDYIDQGVEAGAEAVVDGRERTSDDLQFGDANLEGGYFIGPTLFDHVTPDMSIYTDEIFGPVLCIVRAENYEEALRFRPSTNTATAWRFSPATATPPATSCPGCRSAWSA